MRVEIRAPRRQSHRFYSFRVKDVAEHLAELGISIHDQVTLAIEESVFAVGQFTSDLFHPRLIGTGRATGEVNAARFKFHHEQQVKRYQSAFGPDFDGGEIDGCQYVPVRLDERSPSCLTLSVWCRLDATLLEDITDGRVGYVIANVGQAP